MMPRISWVSTSPIPASEFERLRREQSNRIEAKQTRNKRALAYSDCQEIPCARAVFDSLFCSLRANFSAGSGVIDRQCSMRKKRYRVEWRSLDSTIGASTRSVDDSFTSVVWFNDETRGARRCSSRNCSLPSHKGRRNGYRINASWTFYDMILWFLLVRAQGQRDTRCRRSRSQIL